MTKTILIFIIASIFEISGCYFVWQWLKNHQPIEQGILGLILLGLYGVIATFHSEDFTKVYVVYGGVFIIASLFWGYIFENYKPDRLDVFGLILISIGIILIYFVSRR
ncbi:MAG: YnfA family protein [Brumimicrobium sp.]